MWLSSDEKQVRINFVGKNDEDMTLLFTSYDEHSHEWWSDDSEYRILYSDLLRRPVVADGSCKCHPHDHSVLATRRFLTVLAAVFCFAALTLYAQAPEETARYQSMDTTQLWPKIVDFAEADCSQEATDQHMAEVGDTLTRTVSDLTRMTKDLEAQLSAEGVVCEDEDTQKWNKMNKKQLVDLVQQTVNAALEEKKGMQKLLNDAETKLTLVKSELAALEQKNLTAESVIPTLPLAPIGGVSKRFLTVCIVLQNKSGTNARKIVDKDYSTKIKDQFFQFDDFKDDSKMEAMVDKLWTNKNNTVDEDDNGRFRKKPQRYETDAGLAESQDVAEIDKMIEAETALFGNKKPKVTLDTSFFDEEELLPGQGTLNPERNPNVRFIKVHPDFPNVRHLKKNYDLARAQLNADYSIGAKKNQKMTNSRSDSFFKRFTFLEKTFGLAEAKKELSKAEYTNAKIQIGQFGSKLRLLFKALVARNVETRSIESTVFMKEDDYEKFQKLFPTETRPKEKHIADVVDAMHNEVTTFYTATTAICESLGAMMELNTKCEQMASLETTDDETVFYHLPDPESFTFLRTAANTLTHLQGLVATEVGDTKDLIEYKAKKAFYEKIMGHIKDYDDFLNNVDDEEDEVEYDDNKTTGTKRKRKSLPPLS